MTAVLNPRIASGSVVALSRLQQGVFTRAQLSTVGVRTHQVRDQIKARRWQAIGPLVVVLHNGPLTAAQERWAVVLNAGPDAALCGRTGAALDGLVGYDDGRVHVVVRRGERPPPLPGITVAVHESRRYDPEQDRRPNRAPPRLRLERNLVDAAAWTRLPRAACGILVTAVQQRLTVPSRLAQALAHAGRIRHRRVLRLAIADIAGGSEALSEIDFVRFCRRYELPAPVQQAVRRDRSGGRRYLDAVFERADGTTFGVEIDGAIHMIVGTYWADCERSNELVIAGDVLLRFPSVAMYLAPKAVADQLRRMLASTRQR